jgi:hypothetical protein
MKITLKNVRLAFPHLFSPQAGPDGGQAKYNGTFIIEDQATADAVNNAIEAVAKEKWPQKHGEILKKLRSSDKVCLKDGDAKAEYDGFEGNHFLNASNKVAPTLFDSTGARVREEDGVLYAGCYVDVSIDVWAQDNNYGKRVNASLRGVKFARDGEPFAGGGAATEDDFEFEAADAEAADDLVG